MVDVTVIKIIDNFFNQNDFELVQKFALHEAYYTPKFFDEALEKSKEFHYGSRFELRHKPKLLDLFKDQAELKFGIKIKIIDDGSGIDLRNLDHFKPHEDTKAGVMNILVMISGPTAVTNGTVFYYGEGNHCELDIHVGFRENRAVMFPSNKIHSQHASVVPNLKRFTATLFIKDYEEKHIL